METNTKEIIDKILTLGDADRKMIYTELEAAIPVTPAYISRLLSKMDKYEQLLVLKAFVRHFTYTEIISAVMDS